MLINDWFKRLVYSLYMHLNSLKIVFQQTLTKKSQTQQNLQTWKA